MVSKSIARERKKSCSLTNEMNCGINNITKEMDVLQSAAQAFSGNIHEIMTAAAIIRQSADTVTGETISRFKTSR